MHVIRSLVHLLDRAVAAVFIALILVYRYTLSPLFNALGGPGGCCRFEPSCSRYGLECFRTHAVPKAFVLTLWRFLRCQPFCDGGIDPVPPKGAPLLPLAPCRRHGRRPAR